MTALENQMKSVINSLESGIEFILRDIISNPPALLGRRLYEWVQSGKILDVEHIGNINGIQRYRKK